MKLKRDRYLFFAPADMVFVWVQLKEFGRNTYTLISPRFPTLVEAIVWGVQHRLKDFSHLAVYQQQKNTMDIICSTYTALGPDRPELLDVATNEVQRLVLPDKLR